MRIETAAVRAENADVLIGAGSDTAAAENALGVIADQMHRGFIPRHVGLYAVEAVCLLHAQLVAQGLKLAASVAFAGKAVAVMHRQEHFQRHFSGFLNRRGIGQNLHALIHRINAGGNEGTRSLYLDHAHAASADFIDSLQVAKGGNINSGLPCGL